MPDDTDTDATATAADDTTTTDDQPLGEAGEKALEAWKARAKTAEADAKRAKSLEAEVAKLKEQHQSAEEKALEAAKAEGRTEAATELGAKLTAAQVELAVLRSEDARKLADPSDALVFLNPADVTDDDGTVNPKAITKAIDELIQAKPHLAAQATPRVPAGARNGAGDSFGDDMNARIRQAAGRR